MEIRHVEAMKVLRWWLWGEGVVVAGQNGSWEMKWWDCNGNVEVKITRQLRGYGGGCIVAEATWNVGGQGDRIAGAALNQEGLKSDAIKELGIEGDMRKARREAGGSLFL